MKLVKLFQTWLDLPPSRKRQWLGLLYDLLFTQLFYARRLKSCGRKTIVQKPLFWTPEFIELGQGVQIWPGCRLEGVHLYRADQFDPNLKIGNQVSFQQNSHVTFGGTLEIGEGSSLMFGVLVTDIEHDYVEVGVPVLDQPISIRPTRIGRQCFIGAGARIQAGTELGDHCIVGANAVVRGKFPDHCVIVGVPARIIKRRDPNSGAWRKTNPEGNFI